MSCTLHDVQEPQSAKASTTTSHLVAISWRRSTGATLVNVGLRKRSVCSPRSLRSVSRRSRKTSPRGLMMSSRPDDLALQGGGPLGQGAGDRRPLAGRVEVDADVAGRVATHRLTSRVTGCCRSTAGPAADDGREQPGAAAGVDDQQPVGQELGDGDSAGSIGGGAAARVHRTEGAEHAGQAHRHPLGAAPAPAAISPSGLVPSSMQPLPEPGLRPARLPEDAAVLRRDDEDGVGHQGQLRVPHGLERPGHRPGQRLGLPRLLVAHAVGPVAGEERHRRGALGQAPLHRQRLPGRARPRPRRSRTCTSPARRGWPGRSPPAGRRRCCGR